LKRCYPLRPAPKAEQVRGSRYCMVCHRPCRRSPCVKCGRPTLLNEQIERIPSGQVWRGKFFVQGGLPDTNRQRH
jgi:hypothetical protein